MATRLGWYRHTAFPVAGYGFKWIAKAGGNA